MTIPTRFLDAPIGRTLGFEVTSDEAGNVVVTLEVDERLWNPMGKLQGGVLSVIADTAMGITFGRELSETTEFATVDFSISYIRPVSRGTVRAVSNLVSRGVSVGFLECKIINSKNQIVATSRCTCVAQPTSKTG